MLESVRKRHTKCSFLVSAHGHFATMVIGTSEKYGPYVMLFVYCLRPPLAA
jgi:hypothetical protein